MKGSCEREIARERELLSKRKKIYNNVRVCVFRKIESYVYVCMCVYDKNGSRPFPVRVVVSFARSPRLRRHCVRTSFLCIYVCMYVRRACSEFPVFRVAERRERAGIYGPYSPLKGARTVPPRTVCTVDGFRTGRRKRAWSFSPRASSNAYNAHRARRSRDFRSPSVHTLYSAKWRLGHGEVLLHIRIYVCARARKPSFPRLGRHTDSFGRRRGLVYGTLEITGIVDCSEGKILLLYTERDAEFVFPTANKTQNRATTTFRDRTRCSGEKKASHKSHKSATTYFATRHLPIQTHIKRTCVGSARHVLLLFA